MIGAGEILIVDRHVIRRPLDGDQCVGPIISRFRNTAINNVGGWIDSSPVGSGYRRHMAESPPLAERRLPLQGRRRLRAAVLSGLLPPLLLRRHGSASLSPSLFSLSSRAHPVLMGTLLIPLSAFIVLRKESVSRGLLLPLSLMVLTGYITAVVAYYALTLHAHQHVDDQYILRSLAALLRYSIYFSAGFYLSALLRSRDMIRAFGLFYTLIVIHILTHVDSAIPSMDFSYLSERVDSLRNYQFYADTFALLTFIVVATRVRRHSRTLVVLIATVCLFLLISRAAFYGYVFVAAVILFDQYKGTVRRYLYPVLYLVVTYWALISPAAVQTESRIAGTFAGDLANSASTLGRVVMLQRGLQHLFNESWLLGDFRAHYKIFATPGTYIHNYLSLWADYGISPVRGVRCLASRIPAVSFPERASLASACLLPEPFADVFKYALAFNTILALGARAHFFPYIFFSFGMLFALREATPPGVFAVFRPLSRSTGVTLRRGRYA